MTPTPFQNPYPGLNNDPVNAKRTQVWLPTAKYQGLQAIIPDHGAITITVALLMQKLFGELEKRGFKDLHTASDAKHFIANCELLLSREYTPLSVGAQVADNAIVAQKKGRKNGKSTV